MAENHIKKQIILKKKEDRRILTGHPWVFSNEIRETRGEPSIGDVVELVTAGGVSLGVGLYNPHSLVSVRLFSQHVLEIDREFFERRISEAASLRKLLYPDSECYRLINGEGDFLPGLVVDKYNDVLVVQSFSYGMDMRLPTICDVLESQFRPRGIAERNESSLRVLEQLPLRKGMLRGDVHQTTIEEHTLRYLVDVLEGQKTGFFLDQRESRKLVRQFSKQARVLDAFCSYGGFALNAANGGATSVLAIDISQKSVQAASGNVSLNGFDKVISFETADVFQRLKTLEPSSFDLIILDPPSFTKTRKNVTAAKKGYAELHSAAAPLLRKGGILLTASCSHHIRPDVFLQVVDDATRAAGRTLQMLDWRGAAPDHPCLPSVPETRYLKCGVFRVL